MFRLGRNGLIMLALLSLSRHAVADSWNMAGALNQTILYNDNISFGFGGAGKTAAFGYLLNPVFEARRKTATLELGVNGQGDIRRYDDSLWDCDNYGLGFYSRYLTRRDTFAIRGNYNSICANVQQLADTGRLVPSTQSESYSVTPSWIWQWTPRARLSAEGSYSKTSFVDSNGGMAPPGLIGNSLYSFKLGGRYEASRRLSLNFGLDVSDIEYTESEISRQILFGWQANGTYAISRKWKITLGGGLQWVDTRQRPNGTFASRNSSLDLGNMANISVNYEDRGNRFSIGYSNSVSPSAIGEVLQQQTAYTNYSYRFTQYLYMDVAASFAHSESIGAVSTNSFQRDFLTGSISLAWEFSKDWNLKGGYVYRWQNSNFEPTSDSNLVMISINYAWNGVRYAH